MWSEEELSNIERGIKLLESLLVGMSDDHRDSGRFTLNYHLPDHMVEDIEDFERFLF